MSQSQIDSIKAHFEFLGFVEDKDYSITMEQGSSRVSISVDVELDPNTRELPEELVPFELEDLDRFLWKGNYDGSLKSWAGINYDMALRSYASSIMEKDAEYLELSERVTRGDGILSLAEWERTRKAIWDRICLDPQIVAWEKELYENYI